MLFVTLYISICSKCHFIQVFVLSSVTSYNYLCQVSIHINICDLKCHVTSFNKTFTCFMYKTLFILAFTYNSMYSCISKLMETFQLIHLIKQQQFITYLMDDPMHYCIFLLNFIIIIIIIKLLFSFTYSMCIISTFSFHINNVRTTFWSTPPTPSN